MEVDNEYEWMEEAGYKPVDGPLPVSKRQQKKGLGPSVYILAFNSIEALEKNYLAQSPSHSLTDLVLHREREGVLNRIMVDKLTMKNRPLGPALSIELPPPGEAARYSRLGLRVYSSSRVCLPQFCLIPPPSLDGGRGLSMNDLVIVPSSSFLGLQCY